MSGSINPSLSLSGSSPSFYRMSLVGTQAPAMPITFRFVGVAAVLPLLFMVAVFGILPLLRSLLDLTLHNLPLIAVQALVALTITIIGVGLYVMRCRKQLIYGGCDCLVRSRRRGISSITSSRKTLRRGSRYWPPYTSSYGARTTFINRSRAWHLRSGGTRYFLASTHCPRDR